MIPLFCIIFFVTETVTDMQILIQSEYLSMVMKILNTPVKIVGKKNKTLH
jgi:diacylglycerol kinase